MKSSPKRTHHHGKPYRGVSHCKSLTHSLWFRIILVVVAISMIVFGFTYAVGIDIFSFFPRPSFALRFVIGVLYILTASFIIHYVFEYERGKEEFHYVCYRCVPVELDEEEEKKERKLDEEDEAKENGK